MPRSQLLPHPPIYPSILINLEYPRMLSAAVCGNIFASPNSQQVTHALRKLENTRGIVIIVKNYTGDVLNFGIAKERWIAQHNTEAIKMVIVGDGSSLIPTGPPKSLLLLLV